MSGDIDIERMWANMADPLSGGPSPNEYNALFELVLAAIDVDADMDNCAGMKDWIIPDDSVAMKFRKAVEPFRGSWVFESS